MGNNHNNSKKNPLFNQQFKGRELILQSIRETIENETGKTIKQIVTEYSELARYKLALWHVTTTNKAVCEAMYIPVEAGTKYKRRLEEKEQLVSSVDKFNCPFTGDLAHFLSTNPNEFQRLSKSSATQLTLWGMINKVTGGQDNEK